MDEKYILLNPITINGVEIKEFSFNFASLKGADYPQIYRISSELSSNRQQSGLPISASRECRIAAAWVAACYGTPGLIVDKWKELSLKDLINLEDFGINFIID